LINRVTAWQAPDCESKLVMPSDKDILNNI